MTMPETAHHDDVELRLPADFGSLPVVRGVAATVAMGVDLPLDQVSDLRLAVDEVCSQVIALARRGAELTCLFRVSGADIVVTAWAPSATGRLPSPESFGWHVLCTLTDDARTWQGGGSDRAVHVEVRKHRNV
ncbi:ATP-binding protein [Actinokineospora pegani]|uniref:ATP-binding protein n=1 Tax=Actinokineospora pegani TaxID=2654637 RepID=UPI0012EA193C|nr:ATP-binding protein [Actinokineospora pegani]